MPGGARNGDIGHDLGSPKSALFAGIGARYGAARGTRPCRIERAFLHGILNPLFFRIRQDGKNTRSRWR